MRRLSSAVVIFASPKTVGRSLKASFVVTDHLAPLIELVDQIEQDLSARLSEGQVTLFVLDDEIEAHNVRPVVHLA